MSPEMLTRADYNKKTDIWSLGITAIEMAEGDPPYSNIHHVKVMFLIETHPPRGLTDPSQWSPEFNNFVKKCLTVDHKMRPTARELLLDPFIEQNITNVVPGPGRIVKNKKGKVYLKELAKNTIPMIEEYRKNVDEDSEGKRAVGSHVIDVDPGL